MARRSRGRRGRPRANPRGVLSIRGGGYGFVQTSEGEYFIPAKYLGGAFDGDFVEISCRRSQGARKGKGDAGGVRRDAAPGEKPEARVVRVIEHSHDTVVGRYEIAEPFGVVVPADKRIPYDIFTRLADNPPIPEGSLVRVRILEYPTRKSAATGVIEEVLGDEDDENIGVELIIARHKLETEFSEGALREAAAARLDEDGALAAGYRDVRERFVFTIDPADARDFDDALSIDQVQRSGKGTIATGDRTHGTGDRVGGTGDRAGGTGDCANDGARTLWRIGVHIADVSGYVTWNSSLDLDARKRATSVYLVDRVIPMLPERLSNDLCSLRPGEDRRTMTVDIVVDDNGDLIDYDIYPALIRSDVRLTYDQVQEILEEGGRGEDASVVSAADSSALAGLLSDLEPRLRILSHIAKQRDAKRREAGGIDFETTEAKVRLDGEGHPVEIMLRRKTDATQLVEEAMVFANEVVARHLTQAEFPCMYRVHGQPDPDELAALVGVFQEFPWFTEELAQRLPSGDSHVIQAIIELSRGRAEEELVSSLLLRSMKRAIYQPVLGAHYGLASQAYCHFTSPIRRYPDLVVHRMLKAQLTKRPEKFDQEVSALPWMAEHSSKMERVADEAARDSQELKIVEFMADAVGTRFSALVSGVSTAGIFVRLENTAEGFIPIRSLGREYFSFDPLRHVLTGSETGCRFRLGQRIAVVLAEADVQSARLMFRPVRPTTDLC